MPFHSEYRPADIAAETFFEPTRIWLFGKPFTALTYNRAAMNNEFADYVAPARGEPLPTPPKRIDRTLRRQDGPKHDLAPILARIYSFSYEGYYYKLPRPLLFLLNGDGQRRHRQPEGQRDHSGVHFDTKFTGLEAKDWNFSDDIRVWQVDRKDLTVCLDVEIGNYQEVLLDTMIAWRRGGASSRGDMASRGDMSFRGDMSSRGDMASRGDMSFRGDMIGPHQGR